MGTPTRYPSGLTNVAKPAPLGAYGLPDPSLWNTYFNDFMTYAAADWTITVVEAGASSASRGLIDATSSYFRIVNDTADDDSTFMDKVGECFLLSAGKKAFFKARFNLSDATESDMVMGIQITDTTPLAVSDGIYFQKDDGDALLDFYVTKDGTSSSALGIATMANSTFVEAAFYYNGVDSVAYYVNGVQLGTLPITNLPNDEALTVSFGVQNGAAASKQMTVDYILVSVER